MINKQKINCSHVQCLPGLQMQLFHASSHIYCLMRCGCLVRLLFAFLCASQHMQLNVLYAHEFSRMLPLTFVTVKWEHTFVNTLLTFTVWIPDETLLFAFLRAPCSQHVQFNVSLNEQNKKINFSQQCSHGLQMQLFHMRSLLFDLTRESSVCLSLCSMLTTRAHWPLLSQVMPHLKHTIIVYHTGKKKHITWLMIIIFSCMRLEKGLLGRRLRFLKFLAVPRQLNRFHCSKSFRFSKTFQIFRKVSDFSKNFRFFRKTSDINNYIVTLE